MPESYRQFSFRTLLWIAVCAAMFFLGRNSLNPELENARRDADIASTRSTASQRELDRSDESLKELQQTASRPTVTFVPDGDTLKVLQNRKETWIRLEGIDCPEREQPFGDAARQFLHDRCFGHQIDLVTKGEDSFGRTLAEVFVDGRSLNLDLLKSGFAWHHSKYNDDRDYAQAERQARSKSLAIWSSKNPIPPWDWRRQHASRDK